MFKKLVLIGALLALSLGLNSVSAQDDVVQTTYTDTIQQFINGLNTGNVDVIDTTHAADFTEYAADGTTDTREGFKATISAFSAAMPDIQGRVNVMVAEGDWAAYATTVKGTFTNPLMLPDSADTIPPTNQPVTWTEVDFVSFNAEGQIIAQYSQFDSMTVMGQLGVVADVPPMMGPNDKVLTDPVGFAALSSEEQAAAFTTDNEARNMAAVEAGCAAFTQGSPSGIYADTYILRTMGMVLETTDSPDFSQALKTAMPDLTTMCSSIIAAGDFVAYRVNVSGTFTNELTLMGIAPTGKTAAWTVNVIDRFDASGKVVEEWSETDMLALFNALGVSPEQMM